jgi:RND family efflux transporter MFP subunit
MADQLSDLSKLRIDRSSKLATAESTSSRLWLYALGGAALAAMAILFFWFRGALSSGIEIEAHTINAISPSQADAVLTASGYVVAQRQAAVASKATGRLIHLGVEEGDQVKEGQILARLENNDVRALLVQAQANARLTRANLDNAKAELADATVNYERMQKLVAEQMVPRSDYDAAEARYRRAQAGIAAGEAAIGVAEASVKNAEISVENTNIRAPFEGTVLTKNADVGEIVAPFGASSTARAAVVTIADMSSLEVEADVSESNIQRIKPEQPCEIVLDAYPETRYPGVVGKIVPTADRAKATVLTKIKFLQRDDRVLPEMSAKVTFLSQRAEAPNMTSERKTVVPLSALVDRNGQKVVFVLRGDTVAETPVALGQTFGSLREVSSGVSVGDRVVVNPPQDMVTGMKVKVR